MLSEQQAREIKKQLINQIETTFPKNKKEFAKQKINSMNSSELEEFLIQNNLIKIGTAKNVPPCIFCLIAQGKIPSYKIGENEEAVAVLEINPISKGHSLIIPKKHINENETASEKTLALAKEISKLIEQKLKPREVKLALTKVSDHIAINAIPIYRDEPLKSKRKKASPEELEQLQQELIKSEKSKEKKKSPKKRVKKSPSQKVRKKEKIKLPKRIP